MTIYIVVVRTYTGIKIHSAFVERNKAERMALHLNDGEPAGSWEVIKAPLFSEEAPDLETL